MAAARPSAAASRCTRRSTRSTTPSSIPRAERPTLPLLPPGEARRYAGEVRGRVLDLLEAASFPAAPLVDQGFAFGMIAQHEQQHDETMLITHQLAGAPPCSPRRRRPPPADAPGCPPRYSCPAARSPWAPPASPGRWTTSGPRTPSTCPPSTSTPRRSPTRHTRRSSRRRLRRPALVDPGGVGAPAAGRPRRAAVLAAGGWGGCGAGSGSPSRFRPRAGAARVLVRGGGVRRLGGTAAAHRGGVGEGGQVRPGVRPVPRATRGATRTRARACQPRPAAPAAAPAGSYPAGAAPLRRTAADRRRVGVDASDFLPYPGFTAFPYKEYSEVFFGAEYKVLRGGSFAVDPVACRGTFRNWDYPIRRQIFAGFRTARDAARGGGRPDVPASGLPRPAGDRARAALRARRTGWSGRRGRRAASGTGP